MASLSIVIPHIQHIHVGVRNFGMVCLFAIAIGGCAEKTSNHGHAISAVELEQIKIGESTRIDVLSTFGQPSFEGAFNSGKIYYVSQFMVEPPGGKKKTQSRELYVLTFDKNDVIQGFELLDQTISNNVLHLDEMTPTPGDNFGVIDQIFSNLKRRRNAE
ncbi:outer membrane protein assembly factor BamE [Alphaproteobacteria bacterium]|nr:outer membrane protein assembly factor BamE [Alphaproteobacteria bacterium]